jgi:bifunctional ADP-heptose synthase (sugar kinase/adenylyltransferase)
MVDFVTVFDEKDPCEIISYLKPQVHIKGGDYAIDEVIERDAVISSGGQLAAAPLIEGFSTSKIIEQIIERFSDENQ